MLDKNNRAVPPNYVKVVRLQCDKPSELKVTLQAVAMPEAGGTCKLRLKSDKETVETPVKLEVIATKTKIINQKPLAPVQKR